MHNMEKLSNVHFKLPKHLHMRKDVELFLSEKLLSMLEQDAVRQLINVASMPGIEAVFAMPDIHTGYGFPIGTVAGADIESGGVISPSGVGFDINCGMRLFVSQVNSKSSQRYIREFINKLFSMVPAGVGCTGDLKLNDRELDVVLEKGARWAVERGYGELEELDKTEDLGCMRQASAIAVSKQAKKRGARQLGTLGSGNHFLEVQYVLDVYDKDIASKLNIKKGDLCIMFHCGSRGLGHQVCKEYSGYVLQDMKKRGEYIADKELGFVKFKSKLGQDYFAAMGAAANFAWANRQVIGAIVKDVFKQVFDGETIRMVCDIAHNIAKIEKHKINGKTKRLCVHRKGATRAFPGQLVIVPGDMGSKSYLLIGTETSLQVSLASCCHGAGRALSRSRAKKEIAYNQVDSFLREKNILAYSHSKSALIEESPFSYKDVEEVIDVVCSAGIVRKVVSLCPLAVLK